MSVAKLDDGVLAADVAMVDLNVVRVETADGRALLRQEDTLALLLGACREHEVESGRHD